MSDPWAQTTDVANVWRPLTTTETARAQVLIDSVQRAIRRTWPAAIARIGGTLPPDGDGIDVDDVRDVVVWSVIALLGVPVDIPANAKAYQITSGAESRSVTLDSSAGGAFLSFLPWMVDVFEDTAPAAESTVPVPSGGAPGSSLGYSDWLFREPSDPRPRWWGSDDRS
jgi:hypothetical protein